MLFKDPVKRGLNSYRYCDNDPADYVDPTGEVANIVGGVLLGGGFSFGGGFLSSAVSQKASGGEIDWWKALGAGINGLIVGATQGGLLASGAGIPAALFANTLAGTAGSAAEQGIGSGRIDPVKSIIDGLSNAVGNHWYKSDGLKSAKDAFKCGAGSGAIISGLNYISDTLFQKPEQRGMGAGLLPGIAGAAFSPYNFLRNPRRGCGSTSPFVPSLGYGSARGYQYDLPKIENGSQGQTKKFSFKDLLLETVIGGITGGVSSAAFYGAGKGIERLKEGLRPKGNSERYINGQRTSRFHELTDAEIASLKNDIREIGADESIFRFNEGYQTAYSDKKDVIFVKGDVLPDMYSTHPRDLMSSKAVLAHEYYGHKYFGDLYGNRNPKSGASGT